MGQHIPSFLTEIIKTSRDIWTKGWAEANAGNISLRLVRDAVDMETLKTKPREWTPLETRVPDLASEYFLVTGSGRYLRNIELYPENNGFRHHLARFYLARSRTADAEQIYRDIAAASPGDLQARADVIRFVGELRGPDAAMQEVAAYIEAEPDNMQLRFLLAQLQRADNRPQEASATLRTVIELGQSAADRNRAAVAVLGVIEDQLPVVGVDVTPAQVL